MNRTQGGLRAATKPLRFIEENILPEAYELPPGKWPSAVKAAVKGLPQDERKAVFSQARRIAAARRKVVDALREGLESVRAKSYRGLPLRDVVLGAVIFGSFTGVSRGEPAAEKALSPERIGDLDFIPVLGEDPKWGVGWTQEDRYNVGRTVRARLERQVSAALNKKASPSRHPIWVRQADAEATRRSFEAEFRSFEHIYPEPWHYIGDEAARPAAEDAIRAYKESFAGRAHDGGGR